MRSFAAACATAVALFISTAAAQAQVSDDVVKIGVLTDMSSLYADATGKGSLAAVEMAVADFGGKVKGKSVLVVSGDHQNKPDVGVGIARNWFDNEKVDAVFDVPTSSVALAIQQLTRDKNKVFINSGGGTSDLTGPACSPTTVHWTYDTYALSNVAGRAMVQRGEDSWFFITADYAFGAALERDASNVVKETGGKVIGNVRHPLNSSDFSSYLLQAQASKAKVVALANAGGDTTNALKQAAEFGLMKGGQKLIALLLEITDVHGIGLKDGQGLILTDAFYWDRDDDTRAFSKRFLEKVGHMPTMIQAGLYSATMHYLKAIDATGTDDTAKVMAQMKATPIHDFFARDGHIREDGRMVHDMYLFEVKKPEESKGDWDLYKLLATVPGDQAFRPLDKGGCPLVKAR
ncbi:ABC transporter substrate-binding protein [Bradyrhizobium sp. U87765 SZCCT0131]|uniref:ABC transporter substrate-binding protein n=1 Tax=unclassified Bradyrhizobium TaxID=2631580 RepID=UPI001BA88B40|nr:MULTISPECIES: ABC transporter substrate-binding protein [unclassified Bradyrhizobium]MBR1218411.1 ABC transporter substrate-binding protein [Bradyrhizobium sp. U87765 SZCCT0131]MBR1260643.1 ABC transporter substrate-binding protein [Bradyrhizobium sp. U87765 SZCCT0134]MBR1303909.1 ABC transporter substrate-binding protein [Bradyrhizobium sp. U87765 SZCCT0110]MBR1319515.1 ABC transporter substrate-binding protein [Bradyrhizobium sp. U87765 SZCCT0109]MBR1347840.1 ABC transporter substrate-bin